MVTVDSVVNRFADDIISARLIDNRAISKVTLPPFATAESLCWVKNSKLDSVVRAGLLIAPEGFEVNEMAESVNVVLTKNPKLLFSKIVTAFFEKQLERSVHPTAFIDANAKIGSNCYIGPFAYIGECEIGDSTIIYGHAHIYDNVRIGNDCILHAGVVIGSDGFGFSKEANGEVVKFPHIGSVQIGNNTEIGSNTVVDRGALGDTVIGNGVKIDNLVHVAHNVLIRDNAYIIANSMLGGSVEVGTGAWIAPSVSILQQLSVGANSTIGVGSVVTKNVPQDETWTGSPAKPLDEFLLLNKKLKQL